LKEKALIFYGKSLEDNDLAVIREFERDNLLLVSITELKQAKSTFNKFIENELSSVRTLGFIYNKIIRSFLRKIKTVNKYKNDSKYRCSADSFESGQIKNLTDYIDAEIYEKADKLSVEIFNKTKMVSFITENFIFNDINLYETNRLEYVEQYFQFLLIVLAVQKVVKAEKPDKIYLSPNLQQNVLILINSVLKDSNCRVIYKIPYSSTRQHLKRYLKRKVRIISEYAWFWILWKVFNKETRVRNQFKTDAKKNLILSHYKNHFPAVVQFLDEVDKNKNIINLLHTPHKHLNYSKEIIITQELENIYLLPHVDINYKSFRNRYGKFSHLLANVIKTNSFDEIYVDSIRASVLIKLSFINQSEKFISSLRYLENLIYVFKVIKPDIITMLSGNDAIDVLATRLAKTFNIPTLFFPHAIYSIRRDHDAFEQDYVICSGKKDEDYFLSLGTEKEKLHVLGLVLFDKLYHKFSQLPDARIIRKKIMDQFNLDTSKKLLLLVTTHDEDFVRERVFKSVIELKKTRKDFQLIVKIHPVEQISFYRNLMKKYGISDTIIIQDIDLHKVIISSDIIIGRSSGAQIEAIFLDKKVIDLSYEATTGRQQMEKFGAVLPVYDPQNLERALNDLIVDKDTIESLRNGRKEYMDYLLYKFDGKASKRIKLLIEKILDK